MTSAPNDDDGNYKLALYQIQVELVKFQKHVIKHGQKVLMIIEGRDASGKDGTIKRIVEHGLTTSSQQGLTSSAIFCHAASTMPKIGMESCRIRALCFPSMRVSSRTGWSRHQQRWCEETP